MRQIATALQFGGGKDSLACLHLLREHWDDLVVVWLNTGAAFPETEAQMREIAALVPHFLEVRTDVVRDIRENGWPVDVVPVVATKLGKTFTGDEGVLLRSWIDCCHANFWAPLYERMKALGFTRIIRGQRRDEGYRNPNITDGAVIDGITYLLPLEDWSEAEVIAFLERKGVPLPAYYDEVKSSLDCWCCTAFLDAKGVQIDYLKRRHPEKHAVVARVLAAARDATEKRLAPLREVA